MPPTVIALPRLSALIRTTAALLLLLPIAATAATGAISPPVPPPPTFPAKGWILVEPTSGRVLVASNADERLEPASLTKLMTAYAVFQAIKGGQLKLQQEVLISRAAWNPEGSKSFVAVDSRVSVENLLLGMIVQSGNDASIALAEAVAGTEASFAGLMNQYAKRLGMTNTNFENSTGLPGPQHYTTARDMAKLAIAIVNEFPEYYRWYSQREFTWNGITQQNRNGLLLRDPSVDGMKTGHTESAGYCLVSSARRNDMRLIAVVMGAASFKAREDHSLALLNYGFSFFETKVLATAGKELARARVWKAPDGEAAFGLKRNLAVLAPRGSHARIKLTTTLKPGLTAPIAANESVGTLRATLDGKVVAERPLYPLAPVETGNLFRVMLDTVSRWIE